MMETTTAFYGSADNETGLNDHEDLSRLRASLYNMSMFIYSLTFVLGVAGNGVVIWVTGLKMKRTVNTVWFLNLAVADFLFTAFLPVGVTYLALNFHWPFGNFMCKLYSIILSLNMFASVYILVMISVDRCVSVVWPVWAQNHRNVRNASYVCLGVWILALSLSAPYYVFRDTVTDEEVTFCFNNFALSDDYETPSVNLLRHFRYQAMTITRFILGFVVPFTVTVSCYGVIIQRLRRNRTLASHSSRPLKIIAAVITTFFLCWAPYHILSLIELVSRTSSDPGALFTRFLVVSNLLATNLAFLNSCLNPLLYVFMVKDFKDKLRTSIQIVFEVAFQEEETQSQLTDTQLTDIRQNNKTTANSEL